MGEQDTDLGGPDLGGLGQAVKGAQGRKPLLAALHVHQTHHLGGQLLRGAGGRAGLLCGVIGRLRGVVRFLCRAVGLLCRLIRFLGRCVRLAAGDRAVHAAQDLGGLGPGHEGLPVKLAAAAAEDAQGVSAGDRVPVAGGHTVPILDLGLGGAGLLGGGGDPLPGEGVDDDLGHIIAADLAVEVAQALHRRACVEAVFLGHRPTGGVPGGALRDRDLVRLPAEEGVRHHGQELGPGEIAGGVVPPIAHAVNPIGLIGPLDVLAGPVAFRYIAKTVACGQGRGQEAGQKDQRQQERIERSFHVV